MKWIIAILLACGGLCWILHDPAPAQDEVVGSYSGSYKGFVDQVEIAKDHRFNQVLKTPDGDVIQSSGTWSLDHKALDFEGYIFFIEEQAEGSSSNPRKTRVTFTAYDGMLIRDWGSGFYKLSK